MTARLCHCGTEVPAGEAFCPACGDPVWEDNPEAPQGPAYQEDVWRPDTPQGGPQQDMSGSDVAVAQAAPPSAPMVAVCRRCHQPHYEGENFCKICGEPLDTGPTETPEIVGGSIDKSMLWAWIIAGVVILALLGGLAYFLLPVLRGESTGTVTTGTQTPLAPATIDPAVLAGGPTTTPGSEATNAGVPGQDAPTQEACDPNGTTAIPASAITVEASSVLPDAGTLSYGPQNTLDGDPNTAWNHNGADGDGSGVTLTYAFDQAYELVHIQVQNGYVKNDEVFAGNHRVKGLTVTTDAGAVQFELADIKDTQQLEGAFGSTQSVTFEINSIYEGSEFPDVALSDVTFTARNICPGAAPAPSAPAAAPPAATPTGG